NNAEFIAAADEVLRQMSEITGLKLLTPLKKSLRSREEIRAYVIKQMNEEKNPAERYADARTAEALGLLPKGFDLDAFMVNVLTEQVEGLYDPKTQEFYIADWSPLSDQRMVMAHELTHALEDQHFHIEAWSRAARPYEDAELGRDAVLEGSAMAAMMDYLMLGTGRSLKDLPEFDPSMLIGELESTPTLKTAPPFLKDALIFPYISGLNFSAAVLKSSGWATLAGVFEKPHVSTQQSLHPELYRSAQTRSHVTLWRRRSFFSFEHPDGAVFLYCLGRECVTMEGSTRHVFDDFTKALDWPLAPQPPERPRTVPEKTAQFFSPAVQSDDGISAPVAHVEPPHTDRATVVARDRVPA